MKVRAALLRGFSSAALISSLAVAQAVGGSAANAEIQPSPSANPAAGLPGDQKGTPDNDVPSDIVVTGTSIRGIAPTGSESIQLDSKAIEATGRANTAQILATIPQLASFGTKPRPSAGGGYPLTSPDIRGLGSTSTLSLLNSHRLVGLGVVNTVSDPTLLPSAAIERIEVVPDGASSTYGSDAIAGVVNVILKRNYSGLDAKFTYGMASGYAETNASIVAGKAWGTGSILVGYQYYHNDALTGRDRSYASSDLSSRGGADGRSLNTSPPNVIIDGVNYGGPGYQAGVVNKFDNTLLNDILPRTTRHSVIANWRQDVGSRVHLFGDANYLRSYTIIYQPQRNAQLTIPSSNPFFIDFSGTGANEETVNYVFSREAGDRKYDTQLLETYGASAGADIDIGARWHGQILGNYGRATPKVTQQGLYGTALTSATSATTRDTAFDPFGGQTNPDVLAAITGYVSNPQGTQNLYQGIAKLDGPVIELPGGDLRLAIGGEIRHETFNFTNVEGPRDSATVKVLAQSRTVSSAFGELYVPVFGKANAVPGLQELTISASARFDHYSDVGNTTNPKVGVSWSPVPGLQFRGTFAKSFHAPSLSQTNPNDANIEVHPAVISPGFLTPVGDTQPRNVYLLAGGNPALKPEKATTYSFGGDFRPEAVPGLRLSATYFHVKFTDRVGGALGQFFTNPALARYVVANPTEAQLADLIGNTEVRGPRFAPGQTDFFEDARPINVGTAIVAGIDYQIQYNFSLSARDDLRLNAGGVTYTKYKTQSAPGVDYRDELKNGSVKWRVRGGVGWKHGPVDTNLFVNYIGPYDNVGVTPTQRVKAFTTVDFNTAVDIPVEGLASGLQLLVNIENLTNEDPPFYNGGDGYNSTYASPVGRLVTAGLRVKF
jgi:iron complex outermembrane recepter protein